jgi:hypothetical protein
MTDHREVPQPPEPLLRLLERLRGDVDQVHARRAAPGLQCLGEQHELLATSATQLDDRAVVIGDRGDDRVRVNREQAGLGACDAIPRQTADGVEEARTESVVQILRLDLFRFEREIASNVRGKFERQRTIDGSHVR